MGDPPQTGNAGGSPRLPQIELRPVPDPTVLTTEQLLREINGVITLLKTQIAGDQAATNIRFAQIEHEFDLVELHRIEQKADTKAAVDAALAAADRAVREQTTASEKSITKSETAAAEQSKQQYATFSASLKAVADTLADVKERVSRIEATRLGASEHKTEGRSDLSAMISVIAIILVIVSMAVSVVLAVAIK
jgi:cobalamin biosynthesis Mg chelatase CobN